MTSWLTHLSLALLAVDDLGGDEFGGGGLGAAAHAFGLRDNHFGDGPGGGDDGRFGPLHGLQALLTLWKHTRTIKYTFIQHRFSRSYSRTFGSFSRWELLLLALVTFI